MILASNQDGTSELTHRECAVILKGYVRRQLCYQTVNSARKKYLEIICGEYAKRVHLFPSFVERLRSKGHHVEYGCVDADTMRQYTLTSAENLYKLEHKDNKKAPKFDKNSVDLSCIVDGRQYIAW